jgi:tetratricopeptide (TPR) repeat protein
LRFFVLIGFLSGCGSYQIAGQVESGRRALLVNDPESALPYLLEAAKNDPNYVYAYDLFRESVWTYLGRSQYATKKYSEARQSLERALALDKDEHLARLYLGLTLTRLGDSAQGVKEIEAGMKGIHDWLEYTESARPFEAYWDPARVIPQNHRERSRRRCRKRGWPRSAHHRRRMDGEKTRGGSRVRTPRPAPAIRA